MNDILEKPTVLVLNRHWQAIAARTPADAFGQMMTGAACGLDIDQSDGTLLPVRSWAEWMALPVRAGDRFVRTVRGAIRVPTVLVLSRYAQVPRRRPALSARAIWERDGRRCQYTGRLLAPGEGNIDHVVPRSRGGTTSWENCVLACRKVNSRKADRLPEEVGLHLLRAPSAPRELPVTVLLRNSHGIADWEMFLANNKAA
jgi:5-methylcytosine-specific restriction endonuclease McrA